MSKQVLSLALRPKSFSGMYGQDKVLDAIAQQIKSKRIPRAWMITGESGSGKTTLARIIAQSLQCPHKTPFGDRCIKCGKAAGIELNASEVTGIDAIKDIASGSLYGPVPPSIRRVYILDEAQRLSKQAQDCLLKYFEDAPKTTAWIICTTEPEAITRTLRRRCMRYSMQQLRGKAVDAYVKYIAKESGCARDVGPFIDLIHMNGTSSPGIIINAFELFAAGVDPDKALHAIDSEVDTLRISQAVVRGEWGSIRSELEKATPGDARMIRASVMGYLRAILLSKHPTVDAKIVASAIKELGSIGYADEGSLPALVTAALWSITKKF